MAHYDAGRALEQEHRLVPPRVPQERAWAYYAAGSRNRNSLNLNLDFQKPVLLVGLCVCPGAPHPHPLLPAPVDALVTLFHRVTPL